jgi:magnesium chelatase family protein
MASLAVAHSRALCGLTAPAVRVEVHLANGLPLFNIVGLPEASVRESRERVRAALLQSGFEFPHRRITVNLAPADLPKDSGRFDLPIAVGILAAAGSLPRAALGQVELIGELSLGGALRPIRGALALACGLVSDNSRRSLILPRQNLAEAALCGHSPILGAATLLEVCDHLRGRKPLRPDPAPDPAPGGDLDSARTPTDIGLLRLIWPAATSGSGGPGSNSPQPPQPPAGPDLADVVGQPQAKRALEIAAAGHHHLLLCGPPGTGKSMLANRLAGLMPPLTRAEALASAAIASLRGTLDPQRWMSRPVRHPHHSVSVAGLVGGGQPPRPGEISLAHQGILFLDELSEFRRAAIEALREPLETGSITVARGPYSETFPASFLLVAAMNPCPCGYLGDRAHACSCTPDQVQRYRARLSGPLLERFDLCVDVRRHPEHGLGPNGAPIRETSALVAQRVLAARRRQLDRQGKGNAELAPAELEDKLVLTGPARRLAAGAARRFDWSMRALHRTLKVARTIADLAQRPAVEGDHVAEAVGLRRQLEPLAPPPVTRAA